MLSSSLRRCSVTGLVMPKNLMFALVPFASKDEKENYPREIVDQLKEHESSHRSRIRSYAGARWARRQAKPSLLKALQRAHRMAKHKAVTSQTVESKARFESQVGTLAKQISALLRPNTLGRRYVVAKLGAAHMISLERDGKVLERSGRASWTMLEHSVVKAMLKQRKDRRFNGATDDIVEQISQQLEEDALMSLRKVTKTINSKGHRFLLMPSNCPFAEKRLRSVIASISLKTDADALSLPQKVEQYQLRELFQDPATQTETLELLQTTYRTTEADTAILVSQSSKTSELCIALWRLHAWRRGMTATSSSSTPDDDDVDVIVAEDV